MSRADRVFGSVVACALLLGVAWSAAIVRLATALAPDAGSVGQALVHWCHVRLMGSPESDDLLLLALIGLLPIALLLGCASIARQWWTTRCFLHARAAGPLRSPSRRISRLSAGLGLSGRLDVVRAAEPYAFCYGLLRPRVCLSTGLAALLGDDELEAVLLHERYHLRSRDPLKTLVVRALDRALFFAPVLGELGGQFLAAKELAADRSVVQAQGHNRWLASALYKLLAGPAPAGAAAAVAHVASAADTRIVYLLDPQRAEPLRFSARSLATSALILLGLATGLFAPALGAIGPHVHTVIDNLVEICPL